MPSTESILPFELEEHILNYLQDDFPALKACALTCHRFVAHAQRVLFARVEIFFSDNPVERNRLEEFCLLASTDIGDLVNELSIVVVNSSTMPEYAGLNMPMLKGLRTMNLDAKVAKISWEAISRTLRFTLWTILTRQSHSLVNLRLSHIEELPLSVFANFRCLEGLFLEGVSFNIDDCRLLESGLWPEPTPNRPPEQRPHLKRLRLNLINFHLMNSILWITNPRCPFDVSVLEELSISKDPSYDFWSWDNINAEINTLLQACANSLQTFRYSPVFRVDEDDLNDVDDSDWEDWLEDETSSTSLQCRPIDFKYLSHLRILRLSIPESKPLEYGFFDLWFRELANQVKYCHLIEEVSIKLSVKIIGRPLSLAALKEALLSPTLPLLHRVAIFVHSHENKLSSEDLQRVREELLDLEQKGTLVIEQASSISGFLSGLDERVQIG